MKTRWVVLACFGLAAGLSQFLWLNFAPILTLVQKRYAVSESTAGLLLLVFPLIYVLLSVHAGSLTDRHGYRRSLVFGTVMMAAFSALRIYLGSFWILLAAQIGISVAQPYVVNAVSKLVLDWFPRELEALATGLGTMGLFLGMALGLALTPALVDYWGLEATMVICALASALVCIAVLLWVRPRSLRATTTTQPGFWKSCRTLLRNSNLAWIFVLAFLGLGYFNGLTTWLEPIVAPNGLNSVQAGILGGVLIVGGIFGSVVIPALSDKYRRRKPFTLLCVVVGLATLYPLSVTRSMESALWLAGIQGFFFLPAFALLLEMCSEEAGASLAGAATGLLMLAGNAGGVLVILAMEWVKGDAPTFANGIALLLVLMALATAVTLRIRETHRLAP